jgi:hypothetical protein
MSGVTGVSGVSDGFFKCHCVAFSYAAASAKIFDSVKCGPQIINPTGKPSCVKPQGIDNDGIP